MKIRKLYAAQKFPQYMVIENAPINSFYMTRVNSADKL